MKLISVIVPVYNVEHFIKRCLDSIIEQTYKNLEIILIDDGSTDNSGAICDEYAQLDKRIRVIHQPNQGLSAARNAGLDVANGDYVMFVDSDDFIVTNAVDILLKNVLSASADIVMCGFSYCREDGTLLGEDTLSVSDGELSKRDFWRYFYSDRRTFYVTVWSKLFKFSLWDNLRFSIGKIHEDEFVIHLLIDRCEKIIVSKEPIYYYVQRYGSIANSQFKIQNLDVVEGMLLRCEFFSDHHDYALAMQTLSTAMYSLLKIYTLPHDDFLKGMGRVKGLYKEFRRQYLKLLFKNTNRALKLKCGIFSLNMRLFYEISKRR